MLVPFDGRISRLQIHVGWNNTVLEDAYDLRK